MSRKLDAAIAEALGYKCLTDGREEPKSPELYSVEKFDGGGYQWYDLPCYSSDGNAMLELIREAGKQEWYPLLYLSKQDCISWVATFEKSREKMAWGFASSLPLAVALAAYKALTGKEWEVQGE